MLQLWLMVLIVSSDKIFERERKNSQSLLVDKIGRFAFTISYDFFYVCIKTLKACMYV